jgi:hypothetical protein
MSIFFVCLALWLFSGVAAQQLSPPLPITNGFQPDAIMVLVVNRAESGRCGSLDGDCLSPVDLVPSSTKYEATPPVQLPRQQKGNQHPCALPFHEDPRSLGQLSLSGNGLFVSFVTYNAIPGSSMKVTISDGKGFVIALVSADRTVDTSTRLILPPGVVPFSAVTDNGTSFWVGASDGLYHTFFGESTGLAWTKLPFANNTRVSHVSIMSVLSPNMTVADNSTELWFSSGQSVWALNPLPYPERPIYVAPQPKMTLPDSAGPAQGHAAAFIPRGSLGDIYDAVYLTDLSIPVTLPTGPFPDAMRARQPVYSKLVGNTRPAAFVAHRNAGNEPWNSYAFHANSDAAQAPTGYSLSVDFRLYSDALSDCPFIAAEEGRRLATYTQVFTTSRSVAYRLRYLNGILPEVYPIFSVGPYDAASMRFAGISLAPRVMMGNAREFRRQRQRRRRRLQEASPSPATSPAASPTRLPTPSMDPSPLPPYVPMNFPEAGIIDPSASPFPDPLSSHFPNGKSSKFLVLVRVGQNSNTAPDYRTLRGSTRSRLLAQPLFVDLISLERDGGATGNSSANPWGKATVLQTLALPTQQRGPHQACTSLFDPSMWPRIYVTPNETSFAVPCYGAVSSSDAAPAELIPNSFHTPAELVPEISLGQHSLEQAKEFSFRYPWPSHPARVIANINASAAVDTRVSFTKTGPCRQVKLGTALRVPNSAYYGNSNLYVSTSTFDDAPVSQYFYYGGDNVTETCGLRWVPLGSSNYDGLPLISEWSMMLDARMDRAFTMKNSLAIYTSYMGYEGLYTAPGTELGVTLEPYKRVVAEPEKSDLDNSPQIFISSQLRLKKSRTSPR